MPLKLPYGFKAEAERISHEIRTELGLSPHDRLVAENLAAHLDIPVIGLAELLLVGADPMWIRLLQGRGAKFSALTVLEGTRRLIVFNQRHPPGRRANSLAHELAHTLLDHPPSPAIGDGGCRRWDDEVESEADWLAGAMLVPREGALRWCRNGCGIADGATHFGVSAALFAWRINHTGISKQVESWRQRRLAK
jgi:hypothetical protein